MQLSSGTHTPSSPWVPAAHWQLASPASTTQVLSGPQSSIEHGSLVQPPWPSLDQPFSVSHWEQAGPRYPVSQSQDGAPSSSEQVPWPLQVVGSQASSGTQPSSPAWVPAGQTQVCCSSRTTHSRPPVHGFGSQESAASGPMSAPASASVWPMRLLVVSSSQADRLARSTSREKSTQSRRVIWSLIFGRMSNAIAE